MKLLANKRIRIEPNVVTLVRRSLKGKGKLSVSVGQEVNPADIIGTSVVASGFRNVNLAKGLGVSNKDGVKFLVKNIGQNIYRGELLAFKPGGLLAQKKIVVSPTDGVIDSYNQVTGELRMSFLPKSVNLPAAVFGVVEKIDADRGQVLIKTVTTQIYGILGSGRAREGNLKILGARGTLTDSRSLKSDLSEHIVVGGGLIYNDAISKAISYGLQGIICGGMNAKDYQSVAGGTISFPRKMGNDIGISILATEGFGSLSIGSDIFEMLKKYEDRFVILEGNRLNLNLPSAEPDSILQAKKHHFAALEESLMEAVKQLEAVNLRVSDRVRIIAPPFMGEQGVILSIDNSATTLPSGVSTYLVGVETRSRKMKVPHSNLEVIYATN